MIEYIVHSQDSDESVLDTTHIPLFHGLSVLSYDLCEMIAEQVRAEFADIYIRRALKPRENPELIEVLGISHVAVRGERAPVTAAIADLDRLHYSLRTALGTLHQGDHRASLFPEDGQPASALVFDFETTDTAGIRGQRLVMEQRGSAGDYWLLFTIENLASPRTDLDKMPYVRVDLNQWSFIVGSTRIALSLQAWIRRQAERGHRSVSELRNPYSHMFAQLAKYEFTDLDRVAVYWTSDLVPRILESEPKELDRLLKHVLVVFEDRRVRRVLLDGRVLKVISDDLVLYITLSQLGRVLNLSLGERRPKADLSAYLERMPATSAQVIAAEDRLPLSGVKVFLIHHITAEVLGLIDALRRLGCTDLTTLFVVYSGEVPDDYLNALLELPAGEFRCLALDNVPQPGTVEGRYELSNRYSELGNHPQLAQSLARDRLRYLEAMQTAAVAEFFSQLARATASGEHCLIVEDGGYLAPALNHHVLDGQTVGELFEQFGMASADSRPLREALDGTLLGTVEHTRSGYDRLARVEATHGRLAFPALSIARSRLKTETEAQDVADTVLNAIENALHASGQTLSRRNCLVIGSRGNIGRCLMADLAARLREPATQLCGVDLRADTGGPLVEAASFAALPESQRQRLDMIVGVTGTSVLQSWELEHWLLTATSRQLILASGSSKTVEFADISVWLDGILADPAPAIGGWPATITPYEFLDPQSGKPFGRRIRVEIAHPDGALRRDLLLLGNLTPVNFMYYGVPTEGIDAVLAQLLASSLTLVDRARAGQLAPHLHAVDLDIDVEMAGMLA
ncbi:MAG: hypothetical protein KDI55_05995 [Anaerolineae bacterium]|nr:hypothetical protein [Anaerolineae bacterium]